MEGNNDVSGTTAIQPLHGKKNNMVIGLVAALVVFIALITIVVSFAKKKPEIINQQFSSAQASDTFLNPLEDGKWEVKDGTYQLSSPVVAEANVTGNTNLSVNKTVIKPSEWELETKAKSTADFSIVFDYTAPDNYYYVNFAPETTDTTNGIFKVENGQQTRLEKLPQTFAKDTNYDVEIRKDGEQIKVYSDNKYLTKSKDGKPITNSKVGYGSRGGSLTFDDLLVTGEGGSAPTKPPVTEPETPPVTPPTTPPSAPPITEPTEGGRAVKVHNGDQLQAALDNAKPGDVITMEDGVYTAKGGSVKVGRQTASSKFRISTSGTASKPITLQGTREAVINGKPGKDGTGGDYGLHLFKANNWIIKGIRVTNNKKGIMLDGSNNNIIDGVMVDTIGHEGVHFRTGSSNNILKNSFITKTGYNNPNYGESVYIGSSDNNWSPLFMGSGSDNADQADHNQILNNTITGFTAEGIDLKEAASFNTIKGNYFDGADTGLDPGSGSNERRIRNSGDSWIDVKGDNNLITENTGVNVPLLDKNSAAFQTHVHGPKGYNSATNNKFTLNKVLAGNQGYGFWIDKNGKGNILSCNNVIASAAKGFSNAEVGGTCKETGN